MFDMNVMSAELYAGAPYFKAINPGLLSLPIKRYKTAVKAIKTAMVAIGAYRTYKSGKSAAHITGDVIGGRIIKLATKPAKMKMSKVHVHASHIPAKDMWRKNGMGSRSWINTPGQYDMVIIFHDANRVGPHIDVHIGRFSVVYRVKPDLYAQLKYNNQGYLTQNSKDLLVQHVRSEIANNSRVPQNLDHSVRNARASWTGGDKSEVGYGAGTTRQIVLESKVDVYKTGPGHPIELYAPALNAHRGQYIYQIYSGENKTAPILIWGNRTSQPPVLHDRLHLSMIDPSDIEKLEKLADMSTSTAKYDGASCYFVITNKGTTVWSPRQSVKTGEQIEYTYKLDGIVSAKSQETIVGMGELLFYEKPRGFKNWLNESLPYSKNKQNYVPAATTGGILNSNATLPEKYQPEIRIYRIDRVGRTSTAQYDFWENRELQEEVALLHKHFKVVDLMSPDEALANGYEGVVVVPEGKSVNDGYKLKYWQDAHDWRVVGIDYELGERGGVAGVVHFESLESGREFKLGSSAVGNRELADTMLDNPEDYIGTVFKVQSRHGHEGRAAKVVGIHQDKGFAPI